MRQQPSPVMPVGASLRAMAIGTCPSGPSPALLPLREPAGADRITRDTDIFLGDTIGEMGLYLRLTEIAFVVGPMAPQTKRIRPGSSNSVQASRASFAAAVLGYVAAEENRT